MLLFYLQRRKDNPTRLHCISIIKYKTRKDFLNWLSEYNASEPDWQFIELPISCVKRVIPTIYSSAPWPLPWPKESNL
jgi:hypothetical protein